MKDTDLPKIQQETILDEINQSDLISWLYRSKIYTSVDSKKGIPKIGAHGLPGINALLSKVQEYNLHPEIYQRYEKVVREVRTQFGLLIKEGGVIGRKQLFSQGIQMDQLPISFRSSLINNYIVRITGSRSSGPKTVGEGQDYDAFKSLALKQKFRIPTELFVLSPISKPISIVSDINHYVRLYEEKERRDFPEWGLLRPHLAGVVSNLSRDLGFKEVIIFPQVLADNAFCEAVLHYSLKF